MFPHITSRRKEEMNNSLTLYRIIMDLIWQNGVRIHDLRNLATYVWAVVGLMAIARQPPVTRAVEMSFGIGSDRHFNP